MAKQIRAKKDSKNTPLTGITTSSSAKLYGENVMFHASRSHGFAAEKANHLQDVFSGRQARHDGLNFQKHGCDRVVEGVQIQTKYCKNAANSIAECFGKSGDFLYWTEHGSPMQIEVPYDQWDDAVEVMARRIKKGQVVLRNNGKVSAAVTDPNQARTLVRRGHYKYDTALKIAKSGTVEGFAFDVANGIQLAASAAGASAVITYAVGLWNGQDAAEAMQAACYAGLKVGGVAWASSVLTTQLGRTGIEQGLRPITHKAVAQIGPKLTQWLAAGTGKNLGQAAAHKHVSKLMRGNIVAAIATTAVLSTADLLRMFEGRLSFSQLFKNVASTAAGVGGGVSGAAAGAAQGASWGSAIPGPGTLIGGIIGGIIGGLAGGVAAEGSVRFVLDGLIEDDAQEMLRTLQQVFVEQAELHLVSQHEGEAILDALRREELPSLLRDMYCADDRHAYAAKLLQPHIKTHLAKRAKVSIPSDADMLAALIPILDRAAARPEQEWRKVYNAERSMSMEVPQSWKHSCESNMASSFPVFALPENKCFILATLVTENVNLPLNVFAKLQCEALVKKNANCAATEVAELSIQGQHVCQFSYRAMDDGVLRVKSLSYVRAVKYIMLLTIVATSEAAMASHQDELDSWIASLQAETFDATPCDMETLFADDDGLLQLVLPEGWRTYDVPNADRSTGELFNLKLAGPVVVKICALRLLAANTPADFAQTYVAGLVRTSPDAVHSSHQLVINGRDAIRTEIIMMVNGENYHLTHTIIQFSDFIVTVLTSSDDTGKYRALCESIAWQVFPQDVDEV